MFGESETSPRGPPIAESDSGSIAACEPRRDGARGAAAAPPSTVTCESLAAKSAFPKAEDEQFEIFGGDALLSQASRVLSDTLLMSTVGTSVVNRARAPKTCETRRTQRPTASLSRKKMAASLIDDSTSSASERGAARSNAWRSSRRPVVIDCARQSRLSRYSARSVCPVRDARAAASGLRTLMAERRDSSESFLLAPSH